MHKLVVGSIVFMLRSLGWGAGGVGQEAPAPRGEPRVVDKQPDNWISITFNVFDHLMEVDPDGKLVPRLATNWRWLDGQTLEVTLRQGVKFHNGEALDAEIVKLNWEENFKLRQPHILGQFMNFKPGSRVEIIDPQTMRFVFAKADGGVLAKLSAMHIANRQFYQEVGWGEKRW